METSSPPKRKRSSSEVSAIASPSTNRQPGSINPFSLGPSTVFQFRVAGLTDTDSDPAKTVPNFPHRGIRSTLEDGRGQAGRHSSDPDAVAVSGEEDADKEKDTRKGSSLKLQERQFLVLLQSINHLLDRGDVARASRAYAIALRLGHKGAKVDVRHHHLWATGAEILMREGEVPISELSPESARIQRQRWGSARNMPKLRAYFEALIQQYPADEKLPNKLSSRDFWAALLSCEVYNLHAEHVIGLRQLEEEERLRKAGDLKQEDETFANDYGYGLYEEEEEGDTPEQRSEAQYLVEKDKLRKRTLEGMEYIFKRMNDIIHELPYRKDVELLKLRATISLYLGDLLIPHTATSPLAMQRAQGERQEKHDEARAALESVLQLGGHLDPEAMAFLGLDEEEEIHGPPMYSSLPIR